MGYPKKINRLFLKLLGNEFFWCPTMMTEELNSNSKTAREQFILSTSRLSSSDLPLDVKPSCSAHG